jgi:outer membrane protein TolC
LFLGVFCGPAAEGRTLTLEECLDLARTRHPELRVRELQEEMAVEDVKIAKGAFYPNIIFRAMYSHINESPSLPVLGGANLFTTVGQLDTALIGATAIQTIYDGRIFALNRLASRRREVAALDKDLAGRNVANTVEKSYFKTLFFKELVGLQGEFHRIASGRVRELRGSLAKGEASELDLSRAEAAEALARSGREEASANYGTSEDELKRLIGSPLGEEIELEGDLDRFVRSALHPGGDRPGSDERDLKARLAEAQHASAVAGLKQKRSEFYPRLYGYLNLYFTHPDLLIEPDTDPPLTLHYQVGAVLEFPLFDGFRRNHEYHKARHLERIALIGSEEAEREVEMDHRRDQRRSQAAAARLEGPRKNREAARRAYEVAKVAYKNDLITLGELLQAEKGWAEAQVACKRAQLDWLIEWSDWE